MWALGLFEIIFFVVFFLLLAVGTAFDRRGNESPKWYVFGIGLVIVVAWFWGDFTFLGLWDTVRTWAFWEPAAAYLGAGLVYSILEFVLDVRRSARAYADSWGRYLKGKVEVRLLDDNGVPRMEEGPRGGNRGYAVTQRTVQEVLSNAGDPSNARAAGDALDSFISNNSVRSGFVGLTKNEAGTAPEPKINRIELAEHIGAWTFLWPAYAVSLVLGDLLTEIFNWLADLLVNMSGRFVRMSFSNVFKF
jgi:hypothetical protein